MYTLIISFYLVSMDAQPVEAVRNFPSQQSCEVEKERLTPSLTKLLENDVLAYSAVCTLTN